MSETDKYEAIDTIVRTTLAQGIEPAAAYLREHFVTREEYEALEARTAELQPTNARWPIGAKVRKKRGSSWRGTVVGYYSTPHTPIGYCVDSAFEPGSCQLWPDAALEDWGDD